MSTHDDFEDFDHQPPNRSGQESYEQASRACRLARERMRDFADGDLAESDRRIVEHHAHECRACAVELARAEFETMRIRRAFAEGWTHATPRTGFAKRALARALAQEPEAALQAEAVRRIQGAEIGRNSPDATPKRLMARVMAKTVAELVSASSERRAPAPRRGVAMALSIVSLVLIVLASPILHSVSDLTRSVRLAVVRSDSAFSGPSGSVSRLSAGDGLGEGDQLVLQADGWIDAEFYDASIVGEQPAAQIRMSGDGELTVGMQLQLDHGEMEILSHRPMGLLLGDGTSLEFGAGLYRIEAEKLSPDGNELALRIQVDRGDAARIAHPAGAVGVVSVGQAGSYGRGATGIALENLAPLATGVANNGGGVRHVVPTAQEPELVGTVVDSFGSPLAHATVRLTFPTDSGYVMRSLSTDHDGAYSVPAGSGVRTGVAMLDVQPPPGRHDLEFAPLDAHRIDRTDGRLTLEPVALHGGTQVRAQIVDAFGAPRPYAMALPLFYDEIVGQVSPWMEGAAWADALGRVELRGLPSRLAAGRTLGVLVYHPQDAVTFRPLSATAGSLVIDTRLETSVLESVRVVGLPPSRASLILEEIVGLPAGLGVRRHLVTADANGEVAAMGCGRGRLWLEPGPASSTLQPIARSADSASVGGEQVERRLVLQPMQAVPGIASSGLELAVQSRFQQAEVEPASGEELFLQAPGGYLPGDAQAFALRPRVGGGFDARFLGLTRQGASLRVRLHAGESELLAIGADGTLARRDVLALRGGSSNGRLSTIVMERTGRAELATALLPTADELRTTWSPLAVGAAGARPELHRVLRRFEGFVAESLPAGDYQVRDALQRTFRVRVLADQTVTIR